MSDNLLAEASLTEFETALAELDDTERHILLRLMELHPVEEVIEILDRMEEVDDVPKYHIAEPDPYAKCVPASHAQNQNVQIGEDGGICVKNPSARWVPELTLHRHIGGTVYTVTGSYSGNEMLDKKLLRVMVRNAENMEESE